MRSLRSFGIALWGCLLALPGRATVECWAPGMQGTVELTELQRAKSVSLGRPYRYDVYGVAGKLVLGDRAHSAGVSNGQFRAKLLGLLQLGGVVESTTYVRLQTGLTQMYPEYFAVRSSRPGHAVGPVHQYGARWTLADPKHPAEVNLTFHLAGSSLLDALLPGLTAPAYYNLNPSGHYYVLGEYHPAPPVMSGYLGISEQSILTGRPVAVGYHIEKHFAPVYRPPFLGLDLGDIGLTVLGTPPHQAPGAAETGVLPPGPGYDLVNITLDLSGQSGDGWLKIEIP